MKVETPVLMRSGPVPFWRGSTRCLDALERCYRKAQEAAEKALTAAATSPDVHASRRVESV